MVASENDDVELVVFSLVAEQSHIANIINAANVIDVLGRILVPLLGKILDPLLEIAES